MKDNTGFIFFVASIVVIISIYFVADGIHFVSPDQYKACHKVCEPNDGIRLVWSDGDCDCNNGAEFKDPRKKDEN